MARAGAAGVVYAPSDHAQRLDEFESCEMCAEAVVDAAAEGIEEALSIVERSADDIAVGLVRSAFGLALLHGASADPQRGLDVLTDVREMSVRDRYVLAAVPAIDVFTAKARARRGDCDGALIQLRSALSDLFDAGHAGWCAPATGILVELLLGRGERSDVQEAEAAIDRLADTPVNYFWAVREVWLVRLRALLAKAHGKEAGYRDYRDRYRALATSLGFEGHMKWAEAMP